MCCPFPQTALSAPCVGREPLGIFSSDSHTLHEKRPPSAHLAQQTPLQQDPSVCQGARCLDHLPTPTAGGPPCQDAQAQEGVTEGGAEML